MPGFVSDKRLYLNEDRSQVVEEGPDARFLLVAEGGEVTEEDAAKYGLKGNSPKQASPLEQEKEALKVAEERGSDSEAEVRRQNVARLEAEQSQSEPKAAEQPAESKAVEEPPANKAQRMRSDKDR